VDALPLIADPTDHNKLPSQRLRLKAAARREVARVAKARWKTVGFPSTVHEVMPAPNVAVRWYRPPARLLILAALLIAAAAVWFAAKGIIGQRFDGDGLPTDPVSYQFVNSRAPAHLVYPNAQTLRVIGAGESHYPAERVTNSAFSGAVLATHDSPAKVYAWYLDRLTANRWSRYQLFALLSTELSAQGYKRGTRELFVIAIDDPRRLSAAIGTQLPDGVTVFEYTYTITASR
jgi:hypothetical protein